MALTNYSELQASVVAWSNRSDLTTLIPDFIRLAEDRINRSLRVGQMEEEISDTIFENTIELPSWAVGVKTLWIDGVPECPLVSRPFDEVLRNRRTGNATAWARQGDNLYFDGDGDIYGVAYKAVPSLSDDNTQNWLLTAYPSVYLYGTLEELFSYTRNMPQAEQWGAKFANALAEVNGADMRDRFSTPLQVKVR